MDGEDGADGCGLGGIQDGFHGSGIEVEGGGVDIGEDGGGPGAENGADRGEEAEGGGDDGVARADSGCGQGQPESVGARGAADGVGHAQVRGRLRSKAATGSPRINCCVCSTCPRASSKFLMERLVLAFEVQHGHGLGLQEPDAQAGLAVLLHLTMVSAAETGGPTLVRIRDGAKYGANAVFEGQD